MQVAVCFPVLFVVDHHRPAGSLQEMAYLYLDAGLGLMSGELVEYPQGNVVVLLMLLLLVHDWGL